MSLPYKNYIFDLYGTLTDIRTDEESRSLRKQTARKAKYELLDGDYGRLPALLGIRIH